MKRIITNTEGQPVVRDLNLKVSDILRRLGTGVMHEQIVENHPGLEHEDLLAVFNYAATVIDSSPWDRIRGDIKEKLSNFDSRDKN